jgi:hypothetical protein
MNFGIVVEDLRDPEAYEQLIRKIRIDIDSVVPYPWRGSSTLKKQFVKVLKYFR